VGKTIYMFASLAARCDKGVTCVSGMRRLARTLHPHGVKITWIVSVDSAKAAAAELRHWHDDFGDDIAVYTPTLTGDVDAKCDQMVQTRDAVGAALPWASLTIAAGGHQDPDIPVVLENTGFEGLWGFCWEQIEVDEITDRGCPWGFYYMDPADRLRPARETGVIGMEWTARDLLKSYHSGNPCLYSTDPNDVARGGLCSWEHIDYWKGLADNYLRNERYNPYIFLLQHQEAHEMERSSLFRCYTEEDIRESAVQLDAFARYIKDRVTMMTLPEAARLYREKAAHTLSSYMLWEDTPTPPHNRDYAWNMACGPWPKTFLYYDRGAQMVFINGKVEPVCIRNYARPYKPGEYFAEPHIPRPRLERDIRHSWSRDLKIVVHSPRVMPYGLALWGDYALYQIGDAPDLVEGKMISRELLFLRYELAKGRNVFRITLEGK